MLETCRQANPPYLPYPIEVSARRLFSHVSICEPSAAAVLLSPQMLATSSLLNALMTVADAFSILLPVVCLFPARVSFYTLTLPRMWAATWAGPSRMPCANTVSTHRASASSIFASEPRRARSGGASPPSRRSGEDVQQLGSPAEAAAAEQAGCHFVIAQGVEADGHVRGTSALLPLPTWCSDLVAVPVVGAGGISTARGVAAVLAAGADAARLGTRFLAAHEADIHPDYLAADGTDTVWTDTFSTLWLGAPHRILTSRMTAAQHYIGDIFVTVTIGDTVLGLPLLGPKHPFAPPAGTSARCRSTLAREWEPCTTLSQLARLFRSWPPAPEAAADSRYPGSVSTTVVLGHLFCPLLALTP